MAEEWMAVEEEISQRIRQLLSERNLTVRSLAEKSGLPQTVIYPLVNGDRNPQIKTMEKICNGLDITLGEFFHKKGELDFFLSREEQRFLQAWRKLDLAEKETIRSITESPGKEDLLRL